MRADRILEKFETTLHSWRAKLEPLDDDAFARAPPDGGWSVAQLCCHVGSVSDMMLTRARQCAEGEGVEKGFQLQPAMICAVGSFPPMRIKVPPLPPGLEHLAKPEPLARADALARLDGMLDEMRSLRAGVSASSPRLRLEHPVGGWLNSRQWYHMNEMHLRHHLRQLKRLLR